MKHKSSSEMSKLLWTFTIPVLFLAALIVGFYLVYGIANANHNAKRTRELLIEQAVDSYKHYGNNFQNLSGLSPELLKQFNPDLLKSLLSGDPTPLYGLAKNIATLSTPAIYVAIVKDGKIIDSTNASGRTVDAGKLPTSAPSSGYVMLDSFGNKKGSFLDLFVVAKLSKIGLPGSFSVSSVFDLTSQLKKADKYFQDQKRNTVISLIITGIVALILFGLLSTFWLRYLINKYIRKPVEELNTIAQDIAAGTYQGEVVVDENSDFAALQGLLKSGQLILRKFDENMGGSD